MEKDLGDKISKVIGMVPELHSLIINENRGENRNRLFAPRERLSILENPNLQRAIEKCVKLRHITVNFNGMPSAKSNLSPFFQVLSNLTSLELCGLYENNTELPKDLAELLARCPNLKSVKLFVDHFVSSITTISKDIAVPDSQTWHCENSLLLEKICYYFAVHFKASPLRLTHLQLGQYLFLGGPKTKEADSFLDKLTDVSKLRDLHFFNGRDLSKPFKINLKLLAKCKSLERLCVTTLDEDLNSWLGSGPGDSIRELRIMENELAESDTPNLTRLSSLFIRGKEFDIWGLSSVSEAIRMAERLAIRMAERLAALPKRTFLDTLPDQGIHLSKLSLPINRSSQWSHFRSNLSKMKMLTHLKITTDLDREFDAPWGFDVDNHRCGYQMAAEIFSICPSLQYVEFPDAVWTMETSWFGEGDLREGPYRLTSSQSREFDSLSNPDLYSKPWQPSHGRDLPDEKTPDVIF
ncbi:hypothetical protein NHQ30_001509 [Ciborinia camelliae]|nr:hypothetical protein NHQ30_001509 [Ciborinia camelliae]